MRSPYDGKKRNPVREESEGGELEWNTTLPKSIDARQKLKRSEHKLRPRRRKQKRNDGKWHRSA